MIGSYMRKQIAMVGYNQVPAWYSTSSDIIDDFEKVGKHFRISRLFPNIPPLYDWIMGFYERPSNRSALKGPTLENATEIIDVGVGTGYLLNQLLKMTKDCQHITAVDLSPKMLANARQYIEKHNNSSDRIDYYQIDCQKMVWPDNYFDLYVSSYLFDLLPEDEVKNAISEMARILRPGGMAILLTMTTELGDLVGVKRYFYRIMNALYCFGYRGGRWNRLWQFMFNGYAPHCRPIDLRGYLREDHGLKIAYSKPSRVSLFPVRIYYVIKTDH